MQLWTPITWLNCFRHRRNEPNGIAKHKSPLGVRGPNPNMESPWVLAVERRIQGILVGRMSSTVPPDADVSLGGVEAFPGVSDPEPLLNSPFRLPPLNFLGFRAWIRGVGQVWGNLWRGAAIEPLEVLQGQTHERIIRTINSPVSGDTY